MKNKLWMFVIGICLALPLVSAGSGYFDALDMYFLLVESVFGSIWLAGIGILAFMVFVAMIAKMSPVAIIWICILFITTFGAGYVGALVAVPAFIAVFIYFVSALVNLINSYR